MAWMPWYERMAEMDSAEEREEYLRGVFGPPPLQGKQVAGMALTALMTGWGISQVKKGVAKKRGAK